MTQEAFFFRESKGALFGSYHPPTSAVRGAAVVLCPPYGHEYVQSHRAFRLMAERLAEAGFPALRFDYRGTGDSAGRASSFGLDEWREDLRAAAEICKARSGRQRICGLGLRLGANLVAAESARAGALDSIVLWDPIASGRLHLEELFTLEQLFRGGLPGSSTSGTDAMDEVLGFPYGDALKVQLAALDISTARAEGTRSALIVHTRHGDEAPAPLELGVERQDTREVGDPRIWMEDADKALIPHEALQGIVEWLERVYG